MDPGTEFAENQPAGGLSVIDDARPDSRHLGLARIAREQSACVMDLQGSNFLERLLASVAAEHRLQGGTRRTGARSESRTLAGAPRRMKSANGLSHTRPTRANGECPSCQFGETRNKSSSCGYSQRRPASAVYLWARLLRRLKSGSRRL